MQVEAKRIVLAVLAILLGIAFGLSVDQDLTTGIVYGWRGAVSVDTNGLVYWLYIGIESICSVGLIGGGLAAIATRRTRHRA